MLKIVAVLALTSLALVTGHIADQKAASETTNLTPQLAYAGIRG